jgi:alkylation response protein AidB-like acyl-CoA dehydrogenase
MFALTEEHHMLADAAKGFVDEHLPTTHLRALRDAGSGDGFDRAAWTKMVEMGWPGVLVPEAQGGSDLGYRGIGLILMQLGATLAPSPLLSTGLIAAAAFRIGQAENSAREAWLAKIAAGETVLALAIDEGPHHNPHAMTATVTQTAAGPVLTGCKAFVVDGQAADHLLVAARDGDQTVLALVAATGPSIARTPLETIDSRGAADISFDKTPILLTLRGENLLDQVLDRARIGLAAEMLGQAEAMFAQTAEYLKARTQFGQLIGSFQGLQHRAGKMLVDLELTRSCVLAALSVLDEAKDDAAIAEYASLAKARAGETLHTVSNEMVQMHGGIGMTDAHDSGLYLKRARVAEALFGAAAFHRDRYATLAGF